MAASYAALIQHIEANAPDPTEPLPLSNRPETIYGATVPFLVVSWAAIGMRMWVRLRVMRDPGWDDYLVIVAGCLNTAASVFVLHTLNHGLGHHYLYIGAANMVEYEKYFYLENAVYITQTTIIKMSLLVQYLRIFKAGAMRWICLTLLSLIICWGLIFGFMAWFPCFPVRAFWRRLDFPNSKCYGYGFDFYRLDEFVSLYEAHTALNMVFDILIFATPMVLFSRPTLKKNNILSLSGIFILGAVIVLTSVWRLHSIVVNRAATLPYIDFTWWSPITLILSCLEINLAIMCASMPVFWPQLEKSWTAIFVTHEVHMTEHHRLDDDYELDNRKGMMRHESLKSDSRNSRESLTRERSLEANTKNRIENRSVNGRSKDRGLSDHYRDPYTVAQIDPFGADATTGVGTVETNVDSNPNKPNWRM